MTSAANAYNTLNAQHQTSSAHSNAVIDKSGSALKLYLVTDRVMCQKLGLIETVCEAIDGGVSFVQLRDKQADDEQLYQMACELKEAIAGRVPLVINDKVHIAKKANLDGAHIGQGDLSVTEARQILGPDAWLGLSINTLSQLQYAHDYHLDQLDYFGLGPVFATDTKPNHARPLGISGLDDLAQASLLPTVAIGGIHLENARGVYQTHCKGIAVVSAICGSDNPRLAAQNLLQQHFLAQ